MSSFLFYSSPPRSSQQYYQTPSTSYFTPQAHRSNPFAWSNTFAPQSPSALRTSKNGNVMRSPGKQQQQQQQQQQIKQVRFVDQDENAMQEDSKEVEQGNAHPNKPFLGGSSSINTLSAIDTQGISNSQNNTALTPSIFQRQPEPTVTSTSTSTTHKNPFQYQHLALASTPTAQLSNQISNNRASRKSGALFLDRLRRTRRDARDQRGAETFEQIDYIRERQKREAYYERQAQQLDTEVDVDEDEVDMEMLEGETGEAGGGEMSPTEDREVEELVKGYYDATDTDGKADGDLMDDFGFGDDDEVFMELLSQGGNEGGGGFGMASGGQDLGFPERQAGSSGGGGGGDGDTEMS